MTTTTNHLTIQDGEGRTETDAAVAAGMAIVAPLPVEGEDGIYLTNDGTVIDVRPTLEKYADRPRRRTGARAVSDVDSFVAYLTKHADEGVAELWADANAGTILAVINAHDSEGFAGWGDHTVKLTLPTTPDWRAWLSGDGKWSSQTEMAEFIQDHIVNFVEPNGATMLELAESFQANTSVEFESSNRVQSGETQLVYKETVAARAGRTGNLHIPDTFKLALQVHERGPVFGVNARLRYRLHNKELRLGYKLDRPADVLTAAFDAVTTKVVADSGHEVWHGTPAGR